MEISNQTVMRLDSINCYKDILAGFRNVKRIRTETGAAWTIGREIMELNICVTKGKVVKMICTIYLTFINIT